MYIRTYDLFQFAGRVISRPHVESGRTAPRGVAQGVCTGTGTGVTEYAVARWIRPCCVV
jgi:hypothetical protein